MKILSTSRQTDKQTEVIFGLLIYKKIKVLRS